MAADELEPVLDEWFDEAFYRSAHHPAGDPRAAFLADGDRLGHRPSFRFDPAFYLERYEDARTSGQTPLRHFLRKGLRRDYAPNRFRQLLNSGRATPLLDGRLLGLAREEGEGDEAWLARLEAAFEAYLLAARENPSRDPSPAFSVAFYRERYADARATDENPLVHFLLQSFREPRQSSADVLALLAEGDRAFDPARSTALVCLHELSLSGAPIVGLDLIEALAETHNVLCLSRQGGELEARLKAATVRYALEVTAPIHFHVMVEALIRSGPIAFALVNSVTTWEALPALNLLGVPILTLVHEFAEYILPRERVIWTQLLSDRLLFSSETIARGWRHALEAEYGFPGQHATIRHQAPAKIEAEPSSSRQALRRRLSETLGLDLERRKLVVAAGSVQLRKGSDLFVATATVFDRLVREGAIAEAERALFLWVGGIPKPTEVRFGLWIDQQIARAPEDRIAFVPAGDYYLDLLRAADLFYLPSRLDPFPNVVIDALCAGTPALLFEGGSGCPDALDVHGIPYLTAAHCDVLDASRKIAEGLANPPDRDALAARSREAFAFAPYLAAVRTAVDAIAVDRAGAEADPLFDALDPGFFRMPFAGSFFGRGREPALVRTMWRRALHAGFDAFSPCDGLNLRNAREARLTSAEPPRTHLVGDAAAAAPADGTSFAIHVHARSAEGLEQVLAVCQQTVASATALLVTCDDEPVETALSPILSALDTRSWIRRSAERDLSALLMLASDGAFDGCELVLHLNDRAPEALQALTSMRLQEALAGGGTAASARALLTAGTLDAIWPDTGRAAPWGAAAGIAALLLGSAPLPGSPRQFPACGMMWARTAMLERVARQVRPRASEDVEPGLMIEALERTWPDLVERAGGTWATVSLAPAAD